MAETPCPRPAGAPAAWVHKVMTGKPRETMKMALAMRGLRNSALRLKMKHICGSSAFPCSHSVKSILEWPGHDVPPQILNPAALTFKASPPGWTIGSPACGTTAALVCCCRYLKMMQFTKWNGMMSSICVCSTYGPWSNRSDWSCHQTHRQTLNCESWTCGFTRWNWHWMMGKF